MKKRKPKTSEAQLRAVRKYKAKLKCISFTLNPSEHHDAVAQLKRMGITQRMAFLIGVGTIWEDFCKPGIKK